MVAPYLHGIVSATQDLWPAESAAVRGAWAQQDRHGQWAVQTGSIPCHATRATGASTPICGPTTQEAPRAAFALGDGAAAAARTGASDRGVPGGELEQKAVPVAGAC